MYTCTCAGIVMMGYTGMHTASSSAPYTFTTLAVLPLIECV